MATDDDLAMRAMAMPNTGVVLDMSYRTIDHPKTRSPNPRKSGPSGSGAYVLRVRFHDGAEAYTHDLPNGDFTFTNPALRLMAALDVTPSTVEQARGKLVNITAGNGGGKMLSQSMLEFGAEKLDESVWGPDAPETDDEGDQNA